MDEGMSAERAFFYDVDLAAEAAADARLEADVNAGRLVDQVRLFYCKAARLGWTLISTSYWVIYAY